MRKKIPSFITILLFILAFLIVFDMNFELAPTVKGGTIYVPTDYPTIQEAVDAAGPGDTVYVYNGTYYEQVTINKGIKLIGEDKDTTIIEWDYGVGDVVHISADSVEISRFTIVGGGNVWVVDGGDAGIDLHYVQNCKVFKNNFINYDTLGIFLYFSNGNTISNNTASGSYLGEAGIFLESSSGNTITENIASSNGEGIALWDSSGNNIANNIALGNEHSGVYLYSYSSGNTVIGNTASGNGQGIWLESSSNNDIISNTASNNGGGIYLSTSSNNNMVADNNVSNNDHGIWLESSSNNDIISNNASNNEGGIYLGSSGGNTITTNIFSSNWMSAISLISSSGNYITNNYASNNMDGISLWDSDMNTIAGNNASNNWDWGLFLESSDANAITNNAASNNLDGIVLWKSNGNTIDGNNASYNEDGILLIDSSGNDLSANTMFGDGILTQGSSLDHWNTHNIDSLNTVNGKPVFYWKNQIGGIVPLGAGQVILANCKNVQVVNQKLTNGSVGIELGFSSNNSIINNTFSNNRYGVLFFSSVSNYLINSSILNSFSYDFHFGGSSFATTINTTFAKSTTWYEDTSSKLTVKWYLQVNVTDYSGNPVPSAKVKIEDNINGMYNETFLTKVDGSIKWIPVTEYVEQKSKKAIYTPYQIIAWKDTLVGYAYPNPFIDESKTVNIVLVNGTLMDLELGWNLISLPRTQSDTNLQTVLSSVEGRYNAVQLYNASDSDNWKHNHISKPSYMNDLNELNHKMGFWLHIIDPQGSTLVVIGNEPTINQSITLYPGWNLVGYPSLKGYNRTSGLNNLTFDTHVDSIWTYNVSIQKWKELGPTDHFEICRGYWIHAKQKCIWEVPL